MVKIAQPGAPADHLERLAHQLGRARGLGFGHRLVREMLGCDNAVRADAGEGDAGLDRCDLGSLPRAGGAPCGGQVPLPLVQLPRGQAGSGHQQLGGGPWLADQADRVEQLTAEEQGRLGSAAVHEHLEQRRAGSLVAGAEFGSRPQVLLGRGQRARRGRSLGYGSQQGGSVLAVSGCSAQPGLKREQFTRVAAAGACHRVGGAELQRGPVRRIQIGRDDLGGQGVAEHRAAGLVVRD